MPLSFSVLRSQVRNIRIIQVLLLPLKLWSNIDPLVCDPGYDVSNVATVQVSIYKAFGHIDLLPWVATAFSLGNAATSPLLNQIMFLVDIKWFTLANWIIFVAASAATGASPTIEGVIVGRTVLGISGGGIYLR